MASNSDARSFGSDSYDKAFRDSIEDRESFWLTAAAEIEWSVPPTVALDDSHASIYRWFPDGTLNTCFNSLDRHVAAGHGDRMALIWDSAMVGEVRCGATPMPSSSTRCRVSPGYSERQASRRATVSSSTFR